MVVDGLDGLGAFLQVAATRSFTAAAKATGLSPSAVSHTVRQLEAKLGVRLFNRTTRSVSLTEAGEQLHERVAPLMSGLQTAVNQVSTSASRPAGLLRLNVPRNASIMLIEPMLREFLDAYPDISLELVVDNGLSDIVSQGFDAGIRFGNVLEKDMHVVPVRPELRAAIVASPDYLARRGVPTDPAMLHDHDCIVFRGTSSGLLYPWDLEKDGERRQVPVTGRLISNDSLPVLQAALDGVGLAYLYEEYVERFLRSGHLVRVLEDWSPREGLYLYFFNPRGMPPKLRVFIDFLMRPGREAALAPARAVAVRVPAPAGEKTIPG
ncbi:MAG TPA: LysR family transcriptional regulator [Janthinobacterium sp.]|nr:LysR family transcriptional regulator [Janthinobacterium sp.]